MALHEELGDEIARHDWDCVLGYGPLAAVTIKRLKQIRHYPVIREFEEASQAAVFLETYLKKGDGILLKGSRSMQVEQIADFLSQSSIKLNQQKVSP